MLKAMLRMLAAVVLAACVVPNLAQAEPVKIRIGYVIPVANWPSFVFMKPEILRHYGKSYTVEATQYRGTPALLTALAVGETDLADMAYSSLAFALENAGMKDLRVIADEAQDGVEGYATGVFYVRKGSGIKKIEDLKGKIVASPGSGAAVDIAARVMLLRHGLEDRRDYTTIEAPWPTMRAILEEKKADFVPTTMPFSFDPKWAEIGDKLFTLKDVFGANQLIAMTARTGTIDKHRAVLVDLFEDVIIALKYYKEHRDEMLEVASKVGKQPPSAFADWIMTEKDYFRDPMLRPNTAGLQNAINAQTEVGILKTKVDISGYVDLSLIDEAAKRIK